MLKERDAPATLATSTDRIARQHFVAIARVQEHLFFADKVLAEQ